MGLKRFSAYAPLADTIYEGFTVDKGGGGTLQNLTKGRDGYFDPQTGSRVWGAQVQRISEASLVWGSSRNCHSCQ